MAARALKIWSGVESTTINNNQAYRALHMPSYVRDLSYGSAEVSGEGVIPLRGCLIELSEGWSELGFKAPCPVTFSEDESERHEQQWQEWNSYHTIQRFARKI